MNKCTNNSLFYLFVILLSSFETKSIDDKVKPNKLMKDRKGEEI